MAEENVNPQYANSEPAGQGSADPPATEAVQDLETPSLQPTEPVVIPDPATQVPLEPGAPEPIAVPEPTGTPDMNTQGQDVVEDAGAQDVVPLPTVESVLTTERVETQDLVSLPATESGKTESPNKIEETNQVPPLSPPYEGGDERGGFVSPNKIEEENSDPKTVEKIVEVEKPISQAQKDQIYHEKLHEALARANQAKHAEYEKHLQEIVDFIRARATLVTNQEIEEGLKMPDSTVTFRLGELIARGVVVRIGEGFRAKYRLKEAA